MSEKIVQLNEEIIKGQIKGIGPRQRGGNPERAAGNNKRQRKNAASAAAAGSNISKA